MIKLKLITKVCEGAVAFKSNTPAYLFEVSGMVSLAMDNGFDYIEDIDGDWYSMTTVEPKTPISDADAEADLAGEPRPDNPSAEATAMQKAEKSERTNHAAEAICKKLDQIIGNTLEINAPIEPQRADTLLKLASLKSILEGTN